MSVSVTLADAALPPAIVDGVSVSVDSATRPVVLRHAVVGAVVIRPLAITPRCEIAP